MKHWLKTSDEEWAIMMEDDCDLSVVKHWPFTWKEFSSRFPHAWDCIQLAIINPATISVQLHRRYVNDFSTACYVINRRYAQKLLDFHTKGDKYKLDQKVLPRAAADDLIYNSGLTFAIPIFLYKLDRDLIFMISMLMYIIVVVMMVSGISGRIRSIPSKITIS